MNLNEYSNQQDMKGSEMKRTFSIFLALGLALAVTIVAVAAANHKVVYSSNAADIAAYGPLSTEPSLVLSDTDWGTAKSAVETWKHPSWPMIAAEPNAKWISTAATTEAPYDVSTWRRFSKTVDLCPGARNISGFVLANSDNAEAAYVDDTLIGQDGEVTGPTGDDQEWKTIIKYFFVNGPVDKLNLDFIVRNYPGSGGYTGNPTGLIFQAVIDYDCDIAPVANAGGPYSGDEGSAIMLDASGSSDPDNDALTYSWSVLHRSSLAPTMAPSKPP
jgi:hypothetical protein